MEEIWKDVIGFEEHYQVSNLGGVKSLDRLNVIGHRLKGRLLSPTPHYKNKYDSVMLSKNGQCKRVYVHILMARAFLDKDYISKGLQCNHIDGDKTNNNLSNLEIVTPSQNAVHAHNMGLSKASPTYGEKHWKPLLTVEDVADIYIKYHNKTHTQLELAAIYGVARPTISDITRGKRWVEVTKNIVI